MDFSFSPPYTGFPLILLPADYDGRHSTRPQLPGSHIDSNPDWTIISPRDLLMSSTERERGIAVALHVKEEDVRERRRLQPGGGHGAMGVRKAYGNECSLMIAVRPPGYHSKPHFHDSDQIIYVLEGEHWFFVGDQGFHCKKGDFLRIPAKKIQWDWNRFDVDSVVVESHAPPMIGGPSGDGAIPLFDEGEKRQVGEIGTNTYVDHDFESVERKYNLL